MRSLQNLPRSRLSRPIRVEFIGEKGIDDGSLWSYSIKKLGGLKSELYTLAAQELFSPEYGLFQLSANNRSIQPNPNSYIIPNHLKLFEFAGLILAKVAQYVYLPNC